MPALVAGIHVLGLEKQTSWPGIGERSDAVLRTARPGNDALRK